MQISDAIAQLNTALRAKPDTPLEGVVAGVPSGTLRGIATCFSPSFEVLNKAAAAGCNLVLCDAHPFYLYDPLWSSLPGVKQAVANAPATLTKRKLIDEAEIVILRLHSAWMAANPTSAARALAAVLKLTVVGEGNGDDFVLCDLPATTAAQLARRLPADGVRMIGDESWKVRRVAVLPGMATPSRLGRALRDPAVDAVIAGEVIEWEGGPYMLDVQATGRKCALLLGGFAATMEPDARHWADWAKATLAGVPVAAFAETAPFIRSVPVNRDALGAAA